MILVEALNRGTFEIKQGKGHRVREKVPRFSRILQYFTYLATFTANDVIKGGIPLQRQDKVCRIAVLPIFMWLQTSLRM